MDEQHKPQESPAEQAIRRYRRPDGDERTLKRRRFTGGLFIANVILIILLYALFAGNNDTDGYRTASFNYNDLQFRLSMTRDRETRDYVFSLTTRPLEGRSATARFNRNMADLIIMYGPSVIQRRTLGDQVTALYLKQGDADVRKAVVERSELKLYADAHPESIVSPRGSLLRRGTPYIPLVAEVRINADRQVGTSLNFNYEVER